MKLISNLAFEYATTTNQDILSLDKIIKKL